MRCSGHAASIAVLLTTPALNDATGNGFVPDTCPAPCATAFLDFFAGAIQSSPSDPRRLSCSSWSANHREEASHPVHCVCYVQNVERTSGRKLAVSLTAWLARSACIARKRHGWQVTGSHRNSLNRYRYLRSGCGHSAGIV